MEDTNLGASNSSDRSTRASPTNSVSLSAKGAEESDSPGAHSAKSLSTSSKRGSSPKSNDKLAATRQSRRIKNGTKKRNSEPDEITPTPTHEDEDDEESDEFDEDLERCVYDLASLDAKACARAHFLDSNAILHQLLIPMALPWTYPIHARQTTSAYDIDDFPGNLHDDDDPQENTTDASPRVSRAADAGVIKLSSVAALGLRDKPKPPVAYCDREIPGELSLQLYKDIQSSKRRKVDKQEVDPTSALISIKFGTVSSRASLFQAKYEEKCPLFMLAVFPRVVRDGQRRRGPEAIAAAKMLGSYNCRAIPPGAVPKSPDQQGERIWIGRNRLIWSDKDRPKQGTNRSAYRSLLTREKVDLARLKRPLIVKIAIRIEGELVSHTDSSVRDHYAAVEAARKGEKGKLDAAEELMYGETILEEALGLNESDKGAKDDTPSVESEPPAVPTSAPQAVPTSASHGQYRLKHEQLFSAISSGDYPGSGVQKIRETFEVPPVGGSNGHSDKTHFVVVPPWIDCLPSEDGLLHVVCSRPGKLFVHPQVNAGELKKIVTEYRRCPVCWQSTADESFGSVARCSLCTVETHTFCANIHNGENSKWICKDCNCDEEKKCESCGMPGTVGQDGLHDVCRIWCDPKDCHDTQSTRCSICSSDKGRVVSCGATRCNVQFHPYCAVVASACAQLHCENVEITDTFLCTQSTLTMIEVAMDHRNQARKKRTRSKTTLPVAFCGYHNPKRNGMLCGLYPNAQFIDQALRVPPSRRPPRTDSI